MGSLMAGWNSPTLDPKLEKRRRNKSLTKEEIAAFWRTKKKIEEEHVQSVLRVKESIDKDDVTSLDLEHHINKIDSGWWTKSSWAFLNQPPETEPTSNTKYASQFHVANLGSSSGMSA
ncbi:hypothetical protein HN51_017763 [Arachis hypogaea]|uniref:Uncharacterized protein n=2 Tax=Arachis TaxID=3817 RepID=A0A445BQZ7_ARAHY|nr:uncharacterized protein LOC107460038 [Arachis duranensis]XP_025616270.1 uncharacterized protein LOC112708298 [Arachis hypogaea]QHO29273.1 uncharacterized protein DS421_8g223820 [Arachis hypogaea]RYR41120.1 hypothetical protein Ahy_A08g037517 [Arachis hypogaea]